jgi:hypothetical protein
MKLVVQHEACSSRPELSCDAVVPSYGASCFSYGASCFSCDGCETIKDQIR